LSQINHAGDAERGGGGGTDDWTTLVDCRRELKRRVIEKDFGELKNRVNYEKKQADVFALAYQQKLMQTNLKVRMNGKWCIERVSGKERKENLLCTYIKRQQWMNRKEFKENSTSFMSCMDSHRACTVYKTIIIHYTGGKVRKRKPGNTVQ
jgi:hypothetical protein